MPGENLLVHGGSSGIGVTAIQLATHFGANTWVTAGSDEKCKFCKNLGAKDAINYRTQDFSDFFLHSPNKTKMDVILDMVGGSYIEKNIEILQDEGRLIFIAFLNGSTEKVNFSKVMVKRLKLLGSTLRPQSLYEKAKIAKSLSENVWPLFDKKKIMPVIDSVFNLEDAELAHERMKSSNHMGKIMLKVSD